MKALPEDIEDYYGEDSIEENKTDAEDYYEN